MCVSVPWWGQFLLQELFYHVHVNLHLTVKGHKGRVGSWSQVLQVGWLPDNTNHNMQTLWFIVWLCVSVCVVYYRLRSTVVTLKMTPLSHRIMKSLWENGQLPMLSPSLPAYTHTHIKRHAHTSVEMRECFRSTTKSEWASTPKMRCRRSKNDAYANMMMGFNLHSHSKVKWLFIGSNVLYTSPLFASSIIQVHKLAWLQKTSLLTTSATSVIHMISIRSVDIIQVYSGVYHMWQLWGTLHQWNCMDTGQETGWTPERQQKQSVNTRHSMGSEVVNQESVDDQRKLEEDFHLWFSNFINTASSSSSSSCCHLKSCTQFAQCQTADRHTNWLTQRSI